MNSMNENAGYIVRFIRRDGRPDEEYFYNAAEDAMWHFGLFADDDSGLYTRIEVSCYATPEKVETARVFVENNS